MGIFHGIFLTGDDFLADLSSGDPTRGVNNFKNLYEIERFLVFLVFFGIFWDFLGKFEIFWDFL